MKLLCLAFVVLLGHQAFANPKKKKQQPILRIESVEISDDVTWSPIIDACIKGKHYYRVNGVVNINICKYKCISDLGKKCQSIVYDPTNQRCYISEARDTSAIDDYSEPCYIKGYQYTQIILDTDVTWSPIINACIKGHNNNIFSGVVNINICKYKCISDLGKKCQSIDYNPTTKHCYISEARDTSAIDDYMKPCYARVCLYTQIILDTANGIICGIETPDPQRIINGDKVSVARKYSWQVGLTQTPLSDEEVFYYCGGSIITDKHILTAAHCFYKFPKKVDNWSCYKNIPAKFYIGIGDHDKKVTTDNLPDFFKPILAKQGVKFKDYNCETHENDIAIVELTRPIDLLKHAADIHPICLPNVGSTETYTGRWATVTGWGSTVGYNYDETKVPRYPAILKEAQVKVEANARCYHHTHFKTDQHMCAGTEEGYANNGKGICQGDSGGPLTVKEGAQYVQIGVVSTSIGCAQQGYKGYYTRVTYFLDWIENNIGYDGQLYRATQP